MKLWKRAPKKISGEGAYDRQHALRILALKGKFTLAGKEADGLRERSTKLVDEWREDAKREQAITGASNGPWNNTLACAAALEAALGDRKT